MDFMMSGGGDMLRVWEAHVIVVSRAANLRLSDGVPSRFLARRYSSFSLILNSMLLRFVICQGWNCNIKCYGCFREECCMS